MRAAENLGRFNAKQERPAREEVRTSPAVKDFGADPDCARLRPMP